MTSVSLKRNITLDVLRGIAVMLVLISHIHVLPSLGLNLPMKALRGVTIILNHGGWVGVDLFFVLSGFLVSGLLFNEYKKSDRINAGRFLIRRGFKIYPSFYVFMGLSICIGLLDPAFYHGTSQYIPDLLFIRNYVPGQWIYWHTWSLDVEEHFYLLLTLAFFIAIKFNRINFKTLAGTYVLLLFIGSICRFFVNLNNPAFDFQTQYTQTHIRLDALFFGVVLSYLNIFEKEKLISFVTRHKVVLTISALLLLIPNFILIRNTSHFILSTFFLSLNPICFGALLMVSLISNNIFIQSRPLSYIGRNSYNIYLWHFLVNLLLLELLPRYGFDIMTPKSWILYVCLMVFLSLFVGVLFTKVLEEPLLKLRDQLFPSKARATTTAVPAIAV